MIALDRLVVGRGAFRAGPFDIHAPAGTVVALVGPNGGGKSTLLATVAGSLLPISGRVARPDGSPALLPPPGAIDAQFAAGHLVALGRSARAGWSPVLSPADRAAALDAMVRLGVGHLHDRPFDRLSSGQRQLVLLARLLAQDAPLCLLDEPTAMLDPAQAAGVERAIRALADAGRTVLVATHAIELAGRADLALTVGPRIAAGPPRAILTPALLSELYGVPVSSCASCGHASAASTGASASPNA